MGSGGTAVTVGSAVGTAVWVGVGGMVVGTAVGDGSGVGVASGSVQAASNNMTMRTGMSNL